ncbi:MAG: phosphatase PAP2 family protein [Chloroflexi bacterium]|nr:phosphatase PAP2 family protein [Chloroflexota bacterium]
MEGISILASPGAAAASILILTAVLLYRRRFRDGFIALAVGIGDLLQEAINLLIGRPRPQGFSEPGDASFPSSHVFHTVLLLGVLLAVLLPVLHRGWQRWTLVGLAFSLALLMGFSRIYLGAHWPSDVLGAYVLGGLALWGVLSLRGLLRAVRRGQRPRPPERS